jgi:hypothetical protein
MIAVQRLNAGLARINYKGETALWARAQVRSTKLCRNCGKLHKERSFMYRPLGNQSYRAERLCAACVERA